MHLRLVIQPAVAGVLAIRAGLKDAREGRPAFLWAAITNAAYRPELLRQGAQDVGKVFVVAVVLDAVYQLIVLRGVFLLELLVVATVLAIVPYVWFAVPSVAWQRRCANEQIEGRGRRKGEPHDEGSGLDETAGDGDPKGGLLHLGKRTIRPDLSQDARLSRLHNHRED
jgi:hypothetical protein